MNLKKQKGKSKGKLQPKPKRLSKRFTKEQLESIRNSPMFIKKDDEARKALATKEFQDYLKNYH